MELVYSLALSTKTFFQYQPTDEEIKAHYRKQWKKDGKKVLELPKEVKDMNPAQKAEFDAAAEQMQQIERDRRFMKRSTKGDASETGLIRFITPILMEKYGGPIKAGKHENALEEIREIYPICQTSEGNPTEIPFSSLIKFNLIIRDMNTAEQNPRDKANNMTVFLKGAPDKVVPRVSK